MFAVRLAALVLVALPAQSLEVALTSSHERAAVGDVLTFTLRVANDAQGPLEFEARLAFGGHLQPVGGRLVLAVNGAERVASGERGGDSLVVRDEAGPIVLPPGGRGVLRVQGLLAPGAKPGDQAHLTAVLVDPAGQALSRSAVSVSVEADAVFERSTLLGRVTCDAAGPGVYGARVVLDTGRTATTDPEGRFHFTAVPPGLRVLKVDPASLPPRTTLVDDVARPVAVTRGFSQVVEFRARCISERTVADAVTGLSRGGARVVVSGDAHTLGLIANGRRFPAEIPEVVPTASGYTLKGPGTPAAWRVLATHVGGVTTLASGVMTPLPASVGAAPAGSTVVLEVDDDVSTIRSAPAGGVNSGSARVEVAGAPAVVDAQGRFAVAPPAPADGTVPVRLVGPGGAERRARLPVGTVAKARVRADFRAGRLEVGGVRADLGASRVRIRLEASHLDSRGGAPVRFRLTDAPAAVGRWEARLLDPDGEVAWSMEGRGAVPETLSFTPPSDGPGALVPGDYAYALDLVLVDGSLIRAPRGVATARAADLGPVPAAAAPLALPLSVEVNGRPIPVTRDDRADGEIDLSTTASQPGPAVGPPSGRPAQVRVAIRGRDGEAFERTFDLGGPALRAGAMAPEVALLAERLREGAPHSTPATLLVELPADGTTLADPVLAVRGRVPGAALRSLGAVVTVNDVEVPLSGETFATLVTLPIGGPHAVEVSARFPDGRAAHVRRLYSVSDTAWFVLAVADGALTGALASGALSGRDGPLHDHTSRVDVGPVGLEGRLGVVLRGRVRGGDLIEQLRITALVDTARETDATPFLSQLIDPDRFYPVYGDSGSEAEGFTGRQKVYVAIEAGRSRLVVGGFRPGLRGVDLFRFDRSLDGALLRVDERWAPGWDTVAEGFASWDDPPVSREVRFEATGGSHFTLPDRELVEGSETVWVEVVDRDTGLVLHRVEGCSDAATEAGCALPYRMDYTGGRLVFMRPVSRTAHAAFGLGAQARTARHTLRVGVAYTARRTGDDAVLAGGFARQTFGEVVELGGGGVRDGRGWTLAGAELRLKLGPVNVESEVARSTGSAGSALLSPDGGLTTVALAEGAEGGAWAYTVRASGAMADDLTEAERFALEATFQTQEAGFSSTSSLGRAAARRGAFAGRFALDARTRLTLRHDTLVALEAPIRQHLTGAGASVSLGQGVALGGEVLHALERSAALDDTHRGALLARVRWALHPNVALRLGQGVDLGGDPALFHEGLARAVTELGVELRAGQQQVYALERVRWNGDDETVLGLELADTEGARVTLEQRLRDTRDPLGGPSTVVGSEQAHGDSRAWSEWQTGTTVAGPYTRAVLGVGRRFRLGPGAYGDLGIERHRGELMQQALSPSDGHRRDTSAAFVSAELVGFERVKLTGRFEVRHSDVHGVREELGLASTLGLAATLTEELTALGRVDYGFTNVVGGARLTDHLNATLGFAWRPTRAGFTLLAKVTHRDALRPAGPDAEVVSPFTDTPEGSVRTTVDVVGLEPLWELGPVQLGPKIAWRRTTVEAEGLPSTGSNAWLTGLRLGVRLWSRLELAAEYRLTAIDVLDTLEHGALGELAVLAGDYVRVGVGYGWGFVEDDGERPFGDVEHGFFVRLAGLY